MTLLLQYVPRRLSGIVHEIEATGESVIFDEDGRRLLVLNDVGAAVWYLIDGARTVEEIVDVLAEHLVERLTVDRARLTDDVSAFLRTLEHKQLVQLAESA